jgi:hypothetical protein
MLLHTIYWWWTMTLITHSYTIENLNWELFRFITWKMELGIGSGTAYCPWRKFNSEVWKNCNLCYSGRPRIAY